MKYLKLFNEAVEKKSYANIHKHYNIDILLDIFNDLVDDYNIEIDKTTQHPTSYGTSYYISLSRGVETIPEDILKSTINSSLNHYYNETGENIYLVAATSNYNSFFNKHFRSCTLHLFLMVEVGWSTFLNNKIFQREGKIINEAGINRIHSKSKMISGSNFDLARKIDDEISYTIKDMLLDLKDDGFDYSLQVISYSGKIGIDIYHNNKFTFANIKNVVNRIGNYLKEAGFVEEYTDLDGFRLPGGRYWACVVWSLPKANESKSNNTVSDSELDELMETCRDILIDLKDDGYLYSVKKESGWIWAKGIQITIKKESIFTFDDVREVIARITVYLRDKGFYLDTVESDVYKFNAPPIDPNIDRTYYIYQVSFNNKLRGR